MMKLLKRTIGVKTPVAACLLVLTGLTTRAQVVSQELTADVNRSAGLNYALPIEKKIKDTPAHTDRLCAILPLERFQDLLSRQTGPLQVKPNKARSHAGLVWFLLKGGLLSCFLRVIKFHKGLCMSQQLLWECLFRRHIRD